MKRERERGGREREGEREEGGEEREREWLIELSYLPVSNWVVVYISTEPQLIRPARLKRRFCCY